MNDLPPQRVPRLEDVQFNPHAPKIKRPGLRLTLRQRFAAWLCAPLERRIQELERAAGEHGAQLYERQQENVNLRRFCEQLSADMAKQTELRSVVETQPQPPRLRTARNWNEFASAATLASRKRS